MGPPVVVSHPPFEAGIPDMASQNCGNGCPVIANVSLRAVFGDDRRNS